MVDDTLTDHSSQPNNQDSRVSESSTAGKSSTLCLSDSSSLSPHTTSASSENFVSESSPSTEHLSSNHNNENPSMPPPPSHVITRSQNNIFKPKIIMVYLVISSDILTSSTYKQAQKHPMWRAAMNDEFKALLKNQTWDLVPFQSSHNVVGVQMALSDKIQSGWDD